MISKQFLLMKLPAVKGEKDLIEDNQSVGDIIKEVVDAHGYFANDYKKIALYFKGASNRQTISNIFNFIKKNIRYKVESTASQTTRSPGAILAMGNGDCKHYASFIGGVLDAIGGFDWCYRFASYDLFSGEPGHVFIVVKDNGQEIWVDPCFSRLDERSKKYFSKIDKRPKMALSRIQGVGDVKSIIRSVTTRRIGLTGTSYSADYKNNLVQNYGLTVMGAGVWPTFANNWPVRWFVDGELYDMPKQWAYNIKQANPNTWQNLIPRLPQGITVEYSSTFEGKPVPSNMLKPYITPDGKMVITTPDGNDNFIAPAEYKKKGINMILDDYTVNKNYTNELLIADNNRLLRLIMVAAGCIQLAFQPDPDAHNIQRWTDRIIRLRYQNNYFLRMDVKTVAGSFIEGVANAVEYIGKGFIKFIGIIPRTAFLQLLRLNIKGGATNLYKNMQDATKVNDIRKKWEGFGGEYNMLLNAARDGSGKPALGNLGAVCGYNYIGEPTTAAAVIAAAAPLIAILANYLKSVGSPELNKIVDTAVTGMNKMLTDAGYDPIAVADAMGGKDVAVSAGNGSIIIPKDNKDDGDIFKWIQDNPVTAGAIGAGLIIGGSVLLGKPKNRRGQ